MKTKELKLLELLTGHEGETFYSPMFGNIKLLQIYKSRVYFNPDKREDILVSFDKDGRYYSQYKEAECLLFPSREQRDWNKWIEEQKSC